MTGSRNLTDARASNARQGVSPDPSLSGAADGWLSVP